AGGAARAAGSRCGAMEARKRVFGRHDRVRHPGQGPGDVAARRPGCAVGAAVERHRAYAQGTLVCRLVRRLADRSGNPGVLAAARGAVRGTGLLATLGRQGHRAHRAQFRASAPVVVVPAAGTPAVVALAADPARAEGRLGKFVAWSLRAVSMVLVDRALRRLLRDQ